MGEVAGFISGWIAHPIPDFAAALAYLNDVRRGNKSLAEHDGKWQVMMGDQLVFTADSRDQAETFVLGFAIGIRLTHPPRDPRPPGVYPIDLPGDKGTP